MKQMCFIFTLALSIIPATSMAEDFWSQPIDKTIKEEKVVVERSDDKEQDLSNGVVNNSSATVRTTSSRVSYLKDKTACYYKFKENKFQVTEEITNCRISLAIKLGFEKACREEAKGSADDLKNCLAKRGTSQHSIDGEKEYIAKLKRDEQEARDNGSNVRTVRDFNYTKKNSVARTFHFWDIVNEHQYPVIHGKKKDPLFKVTTVRSDGRVKRNWDGLNVINNAKELCQSLSHDGHSFEDVMVDMGGEVFSSRQILSVRNQLSLNPYASEDLSSRDRKFHPSPLLIGIGDLSKNGEDRFVSHKYNYTSGDADDSEKKLDKLIKELDKYYMFIKITCVRKLVDGEEANEDKWRKERSLGQDRYIVSEIVDYRAEEVDEKDTVVNGASPRYYFDSQGNAILLNGGTTERKPVSREVRHSQFTGRTRNSE